MILTKDKIGGVYMTKINLIAPNGDKIQAELVRFFEAYGKKYLVYTLNEKDEQGFIKLYVARIEDEQGGSAKVIGEFIEDDNEWKSVKDEFKKIIGENNDSGTTSANDQNPSALEGISIRGHRVIKLMESYVNLLGANQKNFEVATPEFEEVKVEPKQDVVEPAPAIRPEPAYQTPAQQAPFPEPRVYSQPVVAPAAPVAGYGYQTPGFGFAGQPIGYQTPMQPYPDANMYQQVAPVQAANYEEMYKDLKTKYDRINAELEKVTNENIELRIKIDDIREILKGN